ncbi:MAG: tetratricopeptide repeat protein [Planctomycetota bacterium]|nr:tetratricopeptide repeat protein [Planctomycetota bacterium]
MDKVTFSNDSVVTEMKDVLCFSVDVETDEGGPLAGLLNPRGMLPALVFLNPDTSVRDHLVGYRKPAEFLAEVQRVKRDEGTISSLRRRIVEQADDLDARYDLAEKLDVMGDLAGYEEQIAEIRRRDPEAKTVAGRRLKLTDILVAIEKPEYDLAALRAFLGDETHKELLFRGWRAAWKVERYLASIADEPEESGRHFSAFLDAGRIAWKNASADDVSVFGNQLARALYEGRDRLSAQDKAFAVEVAEKAVAAEPEAASVLDTLACCLYMNGRTKEAIAHVERCIELEPENPEWRWRLEEFAGK